MGQRQSENLETPATLAKKNPACVPRFSKGTWPMSMNTPIAAGILVLSTIMASCQPAGSAATSGTATHQMEATDREAKLPTREY
jgi:hypothetical protein